jgi:outer membrane lipoprotein SlyB
MRIPVTILALAAAISFVAPASATERGAVGGAVVGGVAGAVVGGPVGAVVGAGTGAVVGGGMTGHRRYHRYGYYHHHYYRG